jgi:TRAP-type mannitol/chloroaromatic compound transport system permease small subunit
MHEQRPQSSHQTLTEPSEDAISEAPAGVAMSPQSTLLDVVPNGISTFNRKGGEIAALLIIPLTVVVIYEVIMRYVFDAPTIWGFELTTFVYGVHYMLGLAYTQAYGGHVKVDVVTTRFPSKKQAAINIFTSLVIFMPVMTALTIWSFKYAIASTAELERNSTSWAPPIYPFKLIMAISFLFLLLQGISDLLQNIKALKG